MSASINHIIDGGASVHTANEQRLLITPWKLASYGGRRSTAGPSRATALVIAWSRLYTSGLPSHAADTRRGEITSDLHEQARSHGAPGAGRAILSRAVRGIPADLIWRERQLTLRERRRTSAMSPRVLNLTRAITLTQIGLALVLMVGGAVATIMSSMRPTWLSWPEDPARFMAATVLAVISLVLLVRPSSRLVGSVALAVAIVAAGWAELSGVGSLSEQAAMITAEVSASLPRHLAKPILLTPWRVRWPAPHWSAGSCAPGSTTHGLTQPRTRTCRPFRGGGLRGRGSAGGWRRGGR